MDKKARNRGVRLYSCPVCGYKGNDDQIVAMNIYKRGLDKIRHTGFVSHGVQSTPLRCNAPPCKRDEETAGIKGRRSDAVGTAGQLQAGVLQGGDS